jgi:hypothetical protein
MHERPDHPAGATLFAKNGFAEKRLPPHAHIERHYQ